MEYTCLSIIIIIIIGQKIFESKFAQKTKEKVIIKKRKHLLSSLTVWKLRRKAELEFFIFVVI